MRFVVLALCAGVISEATLKNYETYVESWDSQYQNAYQGLVTNSSSEYQTYEGVSLNVCFAAYLFTSGSSGGYNYAPGPSGLNGTQFNFSGNTYGNQDPTVSDIITYVHTHGNGKVKVSFGGNSYAIPFAPSYFISQTAAWGTSNNPDYDTLVNGVVNVVTTLGLDGVDFDIEDPLPQQSTATQFASQLTTFLQKVREGLPGYEITLTIPAQAWGQYWQYLAQNVASLGIVNAINFMEYDIWINPDLSTGYSGQIEADIITYTSPTTESPPPNWAPGWGISPSIVQVGVMPGNDDLQNNLTPTDAQTVAQFALDDGLYGVLMWDIDRDSNYDQTPTPWIGSNPAYQYSNIIRDVLFSNDPAINLTLTAPVRRRFIPYRLPISHKSPPAMGSPPHYQYSNNG